jgi:hypothetical protein
MRLRLDLHMYSLQQSAARRRVLSPAFCQGTPHVYHPVLLTNLAAVAAAGCCMVAQQLSAPVVPASCRNCRHSWATGSGQHSQLEMQCVQFERQHQQDDHDAVQ